MRKRKYTFIPRSLSSKIILHIHTICHFVNKHSEQRNKDIYREHRISLFILLPLSLHPPKYSIHNATGVLFVRAHAYMCTVQTYTFGNIICIHVSLHSGREITLRDIDCSLDRRELPFSASPIQPYRLSPHQFLFFPRVTLSFHAQSSFVNDRTLINRSVD